jgi:hypothetical protein
MGIAGNDNTTRFNFPGAFTGLQSPDPGITVAHEFKPQETAYTADYECWTGEGVWPIFSQFYEIEPSPWTTSNESELQYPDLRDCDHRQ